MGTSKSNSGPKSGSSLLPSWADDGIPNDSDIDNVNDSSIDTDEDDASSDTAQPEKNLNETSAITTNNWTSAKSTMGRFANNSSGVAVKSVGRGYVKAYGGAKNATKAARGGISGAIALGGILSQFAKVGVDTTLRSIGLNDCIGKDADYVLQRLIDEIAPSGATSEEAITREAMVKAMANLYERLSLTNQQIEQLDTLGEHELRIVILDYIKEYIFTKCCYEIGVSIENKSISPTEIIAREDEMKRFIDAAVSSDYKNKNVLDIDFSVSESREIISEIVEQAYLIMEK